MVEEGTQSAGFRLQVNWGLVGVLAGVFALALTTCAAWFAALPLLGNPLSIEWLIFAVALTGALGWWASNLWRGFSDKARVAMVSLMGLSSLFLVVGVVANPVVVDGVVYVKGSQVYNEVTYANGLADDLLTLGGMDVFLTDTTAQAWNRSADIEKAQIEAAEISNKYGKIVQDRAIPAGPLGPPTTSTMAAAYEMSKSLELRLALLDTGSDEEIDQLVESRNTFVQSWKQAGQELGSAAKELNIPLSVEEGPREA